MNKKIIGLQRKKVKLLPHNPEWKKAYKKEERILYSSVGKYILDIQHIGSTSIPGAVAKPIIDIAMGVKSFGVINKLIEPLEELGYEHRKESGTKDRHFFAKGSEENRTHYLHIEELNSSKWENDIFFRDYLRKNKKVVKEYSELKKELAKKYKDDRDTYTSLKDSFISKILKRK